MVILSPTSQARRELILESALKVFAHFGYRKTSMEDVARMAEASRQCLYSHFGSKKSLFQATVIHFLETSLEEVSRILVDPVLDLQTKLIRIFDEVEGKQLIPSMTGRWELMGASHLHVSEGVFESYRTRLDQSVETLIQESIHAGTVVLKQSTALEAAETLRVASSGIASLTERRDDFLKQMEKAVRVILPIVEPRE